MIEQYMIKGFPFSNIEDMIYNPSIPNYLKQVEKITFTGTKSSMVLFVNLHDLMVYSVGIKGNEIISAPKENNYIMNPNYEDAEIYCVNKTLEEILYF